MSYKFCLITLFLLSYYHISSYGFDNSKVSFKYNTTTINNCIISNNIYFHNHSINTIQKDTNKKDNRNLTIHSSFSMFNNSMSKENLIDKKRMYKKCGFNTLWLCILLEYHKNSNSIKVPLWYKEFHKLGGLKNTITFLENKLGTKIDCIKLHKSYFFKDSENEPEAFYEFCKEILDELYDLGINKLFISNEEPQRTKTNSIWVNSFIKIIEYAHKKNIKIGFSMNNYIKTIENMDKSLVENVDMLYENFYPTLSFKDLDTEYSDLPKMIRLCETELNKSQSILKQKNISHKYGISECGIINRVKGLRYPYKWDDKSPIDNSGKIVDLFWRSIIPAAKKSGVTEIANWFMDEEPSKIYKKSMFEFIHNSLYD